MQFNHFDAHGQAIMVDVSAKQPTQRTATAEALVQLSPELAARIGTGGTPKGDVLGVARLAGIAAVKKTPDLIPLSHPLAIHHAAIEFNLDIASARLSIHCTVRAFERTGVEMEAMTGASVAALTVYDMVKGADKSVEICGVRLLFKEGGKSGTYHRSASGAGW